MVRGALQRHTKIPLLCPVDRRILKRHTLTPPRRSPSPGRRRATQVLADQGRGLSEGRSPEFRSPRQYRVAQGTRVAGAAPGWPFLWLLSFGQAKESMPAPPARKTADPATRLANQEERGDCCRFSRRLRLAPQGGLLRSAGRPLGEQDFQRDGVSGKSMPSAPASSSLTAPAIR
jgi:hypothetical protein